jgi:hypothetical protein
MRNLRTVSKPITNSAATPTPIVIFQKFDARTRSRVTDPSPRIGVESISPADSGSCDDGVN